MRIQTRVIIIMIVLLSGMLLFFSQNKPQAPDLTFTSIENRTWHKKDLQNKVILVTFWATSCPGCIQEMPELIKIYQRFALRGFEIIAVAMHYDSPHFVLNYVKEKKLPFFVTLDSLGTIAKAYGEVNMVPTSFLINKKGEIIQKIIGIPDFKQLNKQIIEHI